jgi:hypothetical protein
MTVFLESVVGTYTNNGTIESDGNKTVVANSTDYVWILVEAVGTSPSASILARGYSTVVAE